MSRKVASKTKRGRRSVTEEFKRKAVATMLDGHSTTSVAERFELANPNALCDWKASQLEQSGLVAVSLEAQVHELESDLQRGTRERDILKSVDHFRRQRMTDVYAAVEAIVQNDVQQTSSLCEVIAVSRSAYCAWSTSEASAHEDRDAELLPLVRDIFWKHCRRYGARRIVAEHGEPCETRRIPKLLEIRRLIAIQPTSFVPKTTDSHHILG